MCHPWWLSAEIKGLTRPDRPIMQMSYSQLLGQWLKIWRKLSCQKVVCGKSKFCKIQGMLKMSKMHATCSLQNNVEDIEAITDFIEFIYFFSKTSKMCTNYNVDSNTKSLNYSKIRFKALIYFEVQHTVTVLSSTVCLYSAICQTTNKETIGISSNL